MRSILSGVVAGGLLLSTGIMARADSGRAGSDLAVTNLVTDGGPGSLPANNTDPNLVNAWGVAFDPNGFAFVADNATGVVTVYDGAGTPQLATPITVPPPSSTPTATAAPTGIVWNDDPNAFILGQGNLEAAQLIIATEDGTISAWADSLTEAILEVDANPANPDHAVYKGIALASDGTSRFLYATDFHNARVDVFDETFTRVPLLSTDFSDPNIPAGFAPFGIQNIEGSVFVTYALQNAARHDNVSGPRLGFVDIYTPTGQLVQRFASKGRLNAPWGIALAPPDFGSFSGTLLIGNFGDSVINAYDYRKGSQVGSFTTPTGADPQGLWGIAFGNGLQRQPANTLFFAAGTDDEANGLYARIDVKPGR